MQVQDRVKELRRVRASELRPHPNNWRMHPPAQQDALRGVLADIGYADALLVRELDDGSLELIDGHLRAETTPDQLVPVLVLDVDSGEAAKILATHDPLAGLATPDEGKLDELLRDVQFDNAAVVEMLADLQNESTRATSENAAAESSTEDHLLESFQVVIECASEADQQSVYERMTGEGYKCRVLTL